MLTSQLVPAVLKEYGDLTRHAMNEYLPVGSRFAETVADYPRRGGKMMRPSLCLATARAFGAPLTEAVRSALVIELLHNALLIHDDIQDESEERRGRPALHVEHGIPLALHAGDTLALLALRPLIDNSSEIGMSLALRVLEETDHMAAVSAEGQAMELGWIWDNITALTEDAYLEMVLKKTCWLATIYPLRVGALIATRDTVDLDPFIRFGFFLGAAFQIHDDVLNLVGEHEKYGKELNGDLWEGKRTLMLIKLFREATVDERLRLNEILAKKRESRTADEVSWMRERMDAYGCIEQAQQIARGLAGAALHEFSLAYGGLPPSRDRQFLEEIIPWVFERRA